MKPFINPSSSSTVALEPFSNEETSRYLNAVKALAMADFATLERLLPADSSEASRRVTLRFDAFMRNLENQKLPPDIQEAIDQQVSSRDFFKKMFL